jgi:hypothetical protein
MSNNLEHTLRAMPGYVIGVRHGTDIGLRLALDQLTRAIADQEQQAATTDSRSLAGARHAYAAATLLDVSRTVAAMFRQ